MEAGSPQQNNNRNELLISQIRELYGRIVYTHKTQEKSADIVNSKNDCFKKTQLLLSVFTTTSLLTRIFVGYDFIIAIAAVLSAAQFGVNSYLKEYDLGKLAQRHVDAALDLLGIREQYLSLLTDMKSNSITNEDAIIIRDRLQTETLTVYKIAPRSADGAYNAASKALKEMGEFTFSDEEIDKFLPENLRKDK